MREIELREFPNYNHRYKQVEIIIFHAHKAEIPRFRYNLLIATERPRKIR